MCRWLEDVFLKVHLQLLITVLTKWTHTRDFEMTNGLKSSVTWVQDRSLKKNLAFGKGWFCLLFPFQWIQFEPIRLDISICFLRKIGSRAWNVSAVSRVSRPSFFFFSCSFNLLHCYSKKEGRSRGRKENRRALFTCCPYSLSYGQPTYHVNVIKLKWEIIWKGELPHLSGLPHLPLVSPTSM